MRELLFSVAVAAGLVTGVISASAETNVPASSPTDAATAEKQKASLDKRTKPIMEALHLDDATKAAKVREILAAHFPALTAWHARNDAQLKELWNQFNQARSDKDQARADAVMAQIDAVYATFKPEHDAFIARLREVLTPEQIETIEDALTINKVKITFAAYGEIFHGLTDEQKAFILKNLKAAREEAIDAGAMTEKSAFFKKYKIKIEAYLTEHGYDVKQSYAEFIAKQKEAAKKSSAKAADEDKKAD